MSVWSSPLGSLSTHQYTVCKAKSYQPAKLRCCKLCGSILGSNDIIFALTFNTHIIFIVIYLQIVKKIVVPAAVYNVDLLIQILVMLVKRPRKN